MHHQERVICRPVVVQNPSELDPLEGTYAADAGQKTVSAPSLSSCDKHVEGTTGGDMRLLSMLQTTLQSRFAMVVSCGTSRRMLSRSMLASAMQGTQWMSFKQDRQHSMSIALRSRRMPQLGSLALPAGGSMSPKRRPTPRVRCLQATHT